MEIYVVFGTTGEYSDRTEWMVAAYPNEEDAKRHVVAASEYAPNEKLAFREYLDGRNRKFNNKYDPYMYVDYTGVMYYYKKTELVDSFKR